MKLRFVLLSSVLLALVTACGGASPTATGTPGATSAPQVTPAGSTPAPAATPAGPSQAPVATTPVTGGNGGSAVHLVVTGGPQAGTYDGSTEKTDCNISSSGSGATFLDLGASSGIGSLTFSGIEGGTNPAAFYFQVLFAPVTVINPPSLQISTLDPNTPDGSGTASLEDKGSTIKWTISGTTKDGTGIAATVECGPVDRN